MTTKKEFEIFYQGHLKPKLIVLDKQRQSLTFMLRIILSIYFILMALSFFAMFDVFEFLHPYIADFRANEKREPIFVIGIIIIVVISVLMLFVYKHMTSPFKLRFKKEIISRIVTFIDRNLTYYAEKKVSVHEFHASQLFEGQYGYGVDYWDGEDYVQGILGNTTLKFSEVNAQEEYCDGEGRCNHISAFKGLFFVFNLNQYFGGTTIVSPSTVLGRLFQKIVEPKFKWNDPELNYEFTVHSDNLTFAHNVLTNDFMHRLLAFHRQLKKEVHLSFVNGKLYVAIDVDKNLFEPPIYSSVVNFKLNHEFFEYLQLSKKIVENLLGLNVHSINPRINLPTIVNPFDKKLTGKNKPSQKESQDSCFLCHLSHFFFILSRFIVILVSTPIALLLLAVSLGAAYASYDFNETIILQRAQTLEKGEEIVRRIDNYDVKRLKIDSQNEDQLVHLNGEATTDDILTDDLFGVTATNTIKLKRVVEMYQWEEFAYGYNYSKVWSEQIIDSWQFHESAKHQNPSFMRILGKTFIADTVKLGAFTLSSHFIEKMDIEQIDNYQRLPIQMDKDHFYRLQKDIQAKWNKSIHFNNGNYYLGKNPAHPQIGDLRIRFKVVKPQTISVIAKQSGSQLTFYDMKEISESNDVLAWNYTLDDGIGLFKYGKVFPEIMFRHAKISHFFDDVPFKGLHLGLIASTTRYFDLDAEISHFFDDVFFEDLPLRLLGFISLFFGLYITLFILKKLLSFSSSFKDSLNWVNWISLIFIAIIIAATLSIVMIAYFWISYSPIFGILLIVIALGILYSLKWVRQLFQVSPVEKPKSMLVVETVVSSKD